ncbi:MAG TPA: hypothetical protein VMH84_07375, partial [Xanthobacteraceae bacterium]|nr:hypothetical protein [Xanthobacteraceae bacterium]
VSGIVGMAGGLGGFLLPIMFGAILDRLGINSSCFMLLYGIVWVSLIINYTTEVRRLPVMGETIGAPPRGARKDERSAMAATSQERL